MKVLRHLVFHRLFQVALLNLAWVAGSFFMFSISVAAAPAYGVMNSRKSSDNSIKAPPPSIMAVKISLRIITHCFENQ